MSDADDVQFMGRKRCMRSGVMRRHYGELPYQCVSTTTWALWYAHHTTVASNGLGTEIAAIEFMVGQSFDVTNIGPRDEFYSLCNESYSSYIYHSREQSCYRDEVYT